MTANLNKLYLAIALSLPMFAQVGEAHPIDPTLLASGNAGEAVAQRQIGEMLLHGDGVSQNTTQGLHWLTLAAAQSDSAADVDLGMYYASQRDEQASYRQAVTHFKRAADLGNIAGADELAQSLIEHALRSQTPKDVGDAEIAQALPYLKPSVVRRNQTSCFYAGYLSFLGRGLPHDPALAEKNMRCAADQGNALAAFWVAGALLADVPAPYAHNTPKIEEARTYLTIAAEHGHQGAAQLLATLPPENAVVSAPANIHNSAPSVSSALRVQPPIPKISAQALVQVTTPAPTALPVDANVQCAAATSETERLRNELEAANRKVAQLQEQIAATRSDEEKQIQGEALNRQALALIRRGDYAGAIPKLRSSITLGDVAAMANLGLLYVQGSGVPHNIVEGMDLMQRAADAGNRTSAENLARIYEHGLYTRRDTARAVSWYRKAQALGSVRAWPALKRLGAAG